MSGKWFNTKDELPDPEELVLIYLEDIEAVASAFLFKDVDMYTGEFTLEWSILDDCYHIDDPTDVYSIKHWTKMIDLPEEK